MSSPTWAGMAAPVGQGARPMRRQAATKIERLEARYPELRRKALAMFDECRPPAEVRQMLLSHYGERVSLSSLERYKRRHWQARLELVRQAEAAAAAFTAMAQEAPGGGV